MISKDHYDEAFSGFQIFDCAVRTKEIYSFVLVDLGRTRKNYEPDKRLVTYFKNYQGGPQEYNNKPLLNWQQYTGFPRPKLAISRTPKEQAVMVASDGSVAVLGAGYNDMEQAIPLSKDGPLYSDMGALATIDGRVYAAGGWRHVCYRDAANHWVPIRHNLPDPTTKMNSDVGFDAIDGFNAEDIYCVGGRGDAWRFNGKRWHQCALPTNMLLENVCCAGDGYVYIGMQSGCVMRGREDKWQIIHEGHLTLPFSDMVWFDGRVWCTSDYGIWMIEDGKFIEPNLPPEVRACSGNLSVADGVMLLAGMYGATVYDGKTWTRLISPM